jgi:TatD DNase family protein
MYTDTHAHLYSAEFDNDRDEVIQKALLSGVRKIILPNIDAGSVESMLNVSDSYPDHCFPLMGIHPTSVNETYRDQLRMAEQWLLRRKFYGIGEIGIDLYWDKTYITEQKDAFRKQLRLAGELKLPAVIHVRESFAEVFHILTEEQNGSVTGVFHCFTGDTEEAALIVDQGFYLGIGGVVTFKNNTLDRVIKKFFRHILLETDAPYLAPVPYRGKRNESSYIPLIAQKISDIMAVKPEEVADLSTRNAERLFGI